MHLRLLGNQADSTDYENGTVRVTFNPSPINLNGTIATVNSGRANFDSLSFLGARGAVSYQKHLCTHLQTYTMNFQLYSPNNFPVLAQQSILLAVSDCLNQGEVVSKYLLRNLLIYRSYRSLPMRMRSWI